MYTKTSSEVQCHWSSSWDHVGCLKSHHTSAEHEKQVHSVSRILLTNITPNPETPRLGLIDINTVVLPRRKKWASQIESIVEKLHDVGVVWGDAMADNILIDRNDDPWIIDFGKGWTEH